MYIKQSIGRGWKKRKINLEINRKSDVFFYHKQKFLQNQITVLKFSCWLMQ